MGEVIRKSAAAVDILADARTTLVNAGARGGDWQTSAEERLGPIVTMADATETRLREAQTAAAPARAAVETLNETGDDLIGRVRDDIWNLVGRPGQDAALDLIFPGGIGSYAEGDIEEQPDRMALLADLLEAGIHPRLSADRASAFAAEIRTSADALRAAVDVYRPLRVRVELAERMQRAIANVAQVALARLKLLWLAEGKSEAEIHTVIPDRPRGTSRREPPVES